MRPEDLEIVKVIVTEPKIPLTPEAVIEEIKSRFLYYRGLKSLFHVTYEVMNDFIDYWENQRKAPPSNESVH